MTSDTRRGLLFGVLALVVGLLAPLIGVLLSSIGGIFAFLGWRKNKGWASVAIGINVLALAFPFILNYLAGIS